MVRIHPDPPLRESARVQGWAVRWKGGPDGAVAQLGERLLCKQEVVGSIPSSSTSSGIGNQVSGVRDQRWMRAVATARCGTQSQEIRRQRRGRCCRLAFLASRIGCSLTIWEGKASVGLDESFAEAKGLSCIFAPLREHKRRAAGRRKHACSGGSGVGRRGWGF